MDLGLSPSQQLVVASARGLLAGRCPPERIQELSLDAVGFDADLWKETATLGWPGLLVPVEHGGSAGTATDVLGLVEEIGRACAPGPYIASAVVATRVLVEAGKTRRARDLLPALALGERVCTLAIVEETGRLEPEEIDMALEPGRVTGRKLFVPDAGAATDLIVIGRGGGGLNAALLPMDRTGIAALPLDTMSGHRLYEVALSDVAVEDADLLGAPGAAWDLAAPALALGALAQCADMVGAAQRVLDLCVEYARSRQQFGRPIGSFQAIQHACADLFRDVESARWITYEAAWRVERGAADASSAVAAAKAYAGEACLRVARRGHQIMGAIGYCEEHPLHLFHKRILAGTLAWGDSTLHLDTVAEALGLP